MAKIARASRERPQMLVLTIITITVILTMPLLVFAGVDIPGIPSLEIETNPADAMPVTDASLAEDSIAMDFTSPISMVIIVGAKDGNVLSEDSLASIARFTASLRQDPEIIPHLDRSGPTRGVTDIGTIIDGMARQTSNGTLGLTDLDPATRTAFLRTVLSNNATAALVSDDLDLDTTSASYLIILLSLDPDTYKSNQNDISEAEDLVKTAMEDSDEGTLLWYPLLDQEGAMQESAKGSMALLPLALIVVLVVLGVSTKSVRDVLLALLCIPLIFVWMVGLSSWLGAPLNTLSVFAPMLVLALGIDYAIVTLHRIREERDAGYGPGDSMERGVGAIGASVALSALTTMIAFLSTLTSGLGWLRNFGITIASGILSAAIIMGLFLPTLSYLLQQRASNGSNYESVRTGTDSESKPSDPVVDIYSRPDHMSLLTRLHDAPAKVLAVLLVTTLLSAYGVSQLETEFAIADFLSEENNLVIAMGILEDDFSGMGRTSVFVLVEGDVASPSFLRSLRTGLDQLNNSDDVLTVGGDVRADSPWHRVVMASSMNPNLTAGITFGPDDIPVDREGVVQLYDRLWDVKEPTGLSGGLSAVLHRDNGNYSSAVLRVDVKETPSASKQAALDIHDAMGVVRSTDGTDSAILTGQSIILANVQDEIVSSMQLSIVITLILCFLLLSYIFGSWSISWRTTLPVLLVAIYTLGSMWLLDYNLNMMTVMMAAISIGVGIDYSIHITERHLMEEESGKTPKEARDRSVRTTGVALMGSAGSSALGFSVLATAELGMIATFGTMNAIMVTLSLLAAIVVLPILLQNRGVNPVVSNGDLDGDEMIGTADVDAHR